MTDVAFDLIVIVFEPEILISTMHLGVLRFSLAHPNKLKSLLTLDQGMQFVGWFPIIRCATGSARTMAKKLTLTDWSKPGANLDGRLR